MSQRQKALLAASFVAVLLAFFYLLTYSGALHNTDERFFYDSILWNHTGKLFRQGWLFVKLLTPLIKLASVLPRTGGFQLVLLGNIIFTSITAAILVLFVNDLVGRLRVSVFAGLVYGMATLAWPYSHYLFREPLAALLLLVLMWFYFRLFQRPRWLTLILTAAAYLVLLLVKFKLIALGPLFVLADIWIVIRLVLENDRFQRQSPSISQRFRSWRERLQQLSVGKKLLVFLGLLVLLHGIAILSTFIVHWYSPRFLREGPKLLPFLALWFSPGWGIFVYVPVLWISVAGVGAMMKRYAGFSLILFSAVVFFVLLAAEHPVWWGYWAFGPRQFVPFLPLMLLPFAFGWRWFAGKGGAAGKIIGAALIGASFLIQLVGVLIPFNRYVYDVYFTANIHGEDITWQPALWPIWGMIHYLSPETVDVAWLRSADATFYDVHWRVVLPILLGFLVSGWLLWRLLWQEQARKKLMLWSMALLLLITSWGILAVYSVHTVYADSRYSSELGYIEAATIIRDQARPGDLLITDLWTANLGEPSIAMLNYCQGDCPKRLDVIRSEMGENWARRGAGKLRGYQRAWLVLPRVMEGDPNSAVEKWLSEAGFLVSCQWTGPQVRLCLYSLPPGDELPAVQTPVRFGDHIQLTGAALWREPEQGNTAIQPADAIQMELHWQSDAAIKGDFVLSTQLIGPDGTLINAFDWRPGNSFHPTNTWQPGETIVDRRAVQIPEDAPPGDYTVLIILYDSASGQRLAVQTPDGVSSDALPVYTFTLEIPSP